MGQSEFFIDTGMLDLFHALAKGPATVPALADATGRPVARVARDIDRLLKHGYVEVVGRKGEHNIYQGTGKDIPATASSGKHMLEHLKKGVELLDRGKARGTITSAVLKTTEEKANEIFDMILKLRERVSEIDREGEEPAEGPLVTVFFGLMIE